MMKLQAKRGLLSFPRRPLLMGIVNVNDDSFCDDGTLDPREALAQAHRLISEGADIIDVGAESARTNREAISCEEEIERLTRFIDGFYRTLKDTPPRDEVQVWPPLLSVNTWRPEVVAAILPLGVDLLNDIGGLAEPTNAELCAQHGSSLLIMHTVGLPKVPHFHQHYPDIWEAVLAFFDDRLEKAQAAGLAVEQLVFDPGIDFAKQREDNLRLVADLERLTARYPVPVLLPISRKTVIGEVLDLPDPKSRDAGTIACLAAGVKRGATIFRVHAVSPMFEALKVLWAVEVGPDLRTGP